MSEQQVSQLFGPPFSREKGPFTSNEQTESTKSASSASSPCSLERAVRRNNYMAVLPLPYPQKGVLVHYIKIYFDDNSCVACVQVDLNSAALGMDNDGIKTR